MKKLILVALLTLTNSITYSQKSTDELTESFFTEFKSDTDKAFDNLFGTNKWMMENKDGATKVKYQIRENASLVGEYMGYEKIGEKSLSESLKIAVYLVKYERQPFRFVFKYYKPKDKWMIFNFSYDESIDDDLEEMMKYDYLTKQD